MYLTVSAAVQSCIISAVYGASFKGELTKRTTSVAQVKILCSKTAEMSLYLKELLFLLAFPGSVLTLVGMQLVAFPFLSIKKIYQRLWRYDFELLKGNRFE